MQCVLAAFEILSGQGKAAVPPPLPQILHKGSLVPSPILMLYAESEIVFWPGDDANMRALFHYVLLQPLIFS